MEQVLRIFFQKFWMVIWGVEKSEGKNEKTKEGDQDLPFFPVFFYIMGRSKKTQKKGQPGNPDQQAYRLWNYRIMKIKLITGENP